jgi:hypothetical protein
MAMIDTKTEAADITTVTIIKAGEIIGLLFIVSVCMSHHR